MFQLMASGLSGHHGARAVRHVILACGRAHERVLIRHLLKVETFALGMIEIQECVIYAFAQVNLTL